MNTLKFLYLAYKNLGLIGLIKHLYPSLRIRYLVYFKPKYIVNQLLTRKGGCTKNGCCCYMTTFFCPYIKDGKCSVYKEQPFFCRIFPIDKKSIRLSHVENKCGYYWDWEK